MPQTIDTTTLTPELADYTDRITTAYRHLANTPGAWVSLADLRDLVGGHRAQVDAALRHMSRSQQANLIARADQSNLTDYDRHCAIELGGAPQHMISMPL